MNLDYFAVISFPVHSWVDDENNGYDYLEGETNSHNSDNKAINIAVLVWLTRKIYNPLEAGECEDDIDDDKTYNYNLFVTHDVLNLKRWHYKYKKHKNYRDNSQRDANIKEYWRLAIIKYALK